MCVPLKKKRSVGAFKEGNDNTTGKFRATVSPKQLQSTAHLYVGNEVLFSDIVWRNLEAQIYRKYYNSIVLRSMTY